MAYGHEIIAELVEFVNTLTNRPYQVTAVSGFSGEDITLPIAGNTVSFHCAENEMVNTYDDVNAEYCTVNSVKIAMTCFVPQERETSECLTLCEQLLGEISANYASQLKGYTVGEIKNDGDLRAVRIRCILLFGYEGCIEESSSTASLFPEPVFACKSHVNDGTIHLTAEEKAYLGEPFVLGTYEGTGPDVFNEIHIGFRPKLVIVFRTSSQSVLFEPGNMVYPQFAFATDLGYTAGIIIRDYGFRVRQTETQSHDNCYINVNTLGKKYQYVAFK